MAVTYNNGTLSYSTRPKNNMEQATNSIVHAVGLFMHNGRLTPDIADAVREETRNVVENIAREPVTKGFIDNLFKLDPTLENHIASVTVLTALIGREFAGMDTLLELTEGALYHDIGKLHTPHNILNKTSKLTPEEFNIIQLHPDDGASMLQKAIKLGCDLFPTTPLVALEHHEKYDGSGYPNKKAGEHENNRTGSHLYSRIVAIADITSALMMRRSYKEPMAIANIIKILDDSKVDPYIYQAFRRILVASA